MHTTPQPPQPPLDPATLLSPRENEILRWAREIRADNGAAWAAEVAATAGLCDWERDLLRAHGTAVPEAGEPDPADAEAAVAEATRQIDEITSTQTRRRQLVAALAEEQDTVDLDEIQSLLVSAQVHVVGPVAWVEELLTVTGQQESGPLLRLMAGVQSVQARRDGNVQWAARSEASRREHDVLTVTARSAGGCWRDRAWELSACLEIRQDAYREVLVRPYGPAEGHSLVVHSAGVPGVSTTYRGEVVGEMAVRWWMAALARQGVRGAVASSAASSAPCEAGEDDMRRRLITADLAAMDLLELATRRIVALTTGDVADATTGDMADAIHQAYPCTPMREEHLLLVTAMAGQAANLLLAAADQAGRDPLTLLAHLREQTVQDAADLMGRHTGEGR